MNMSKLLTIITLSLFCFSIYSLDVIKLFTPVSDLDARNVYTDKLLFAALEETVDEFGKYEIIRYKKTLNRGRVLQEMKKGININVHVAPTRAEWENELITIYIPVKKGLLSYRLFLIDRKNSDSFNMINSISELKTYKVGLGAQWSTKEVMEKLEFNIVTGIKYESLFTMLRNNRFDYFPRGVDEIFDEYDTRKSQLEDIIIEETKALYITSPIYFFVSPEEPQLAKRIEHGLKLIIQNGTFDEIFYSEFNDDIERANLANREIFYIENPLLSVHTPLNDKTLWYKP